MKYCNKCISFPSCKAAVKFGLRFLILLVLCLSTPTMSSSALETLAKANQKFTLDLYKTLRKYNDGNIFFSPLSLKMALAMVYTGARGSTAAQLQKGLHLPSDNAVVRKGIEEMMKSLKSTEAYTLEIANQVFVQEDYVLLEEFQKIMEKHFLAKAANKNFKTNAEVSRVEINEWVEKITHNKIKDLLSPGMLDADTRLVLVNAIYFKGLWVNQFDKAATRPHPFYISEDQKIDVPMMNKESDYLYGEFEDLKCAALGLPYKGDELALVIFLPTERTGLHSLEDKLIGVDIAAKIKEMHKTKVRVTMPKWKMEETINLNSILSDMGMGEMFSNSADFSGISGTPELKVSQVVQKAFIEVNEEGSEAAAATGAVMRLKRSLHTNLQFVADHPFVFCIFNTRHHSVLFWGRLKEPEVSGLQHDEL